MPFQKINHWLKKLGPGLLFAGAAIGVSHLVQSTSAGAQFGFQLVWAVLIANLIKYPFFEFGPRYTGATGESLLAGYKKLGAWAIGVIILITIGTMFTIQAAVTVVTAGIASSIFQSGIGAVNWSMIILAICMLILVIGKYSLLDKLIKYIIIILSISTITTVIIAFQSPAVQAPEFLTKFTWNKAGITFLIALMGWMPAPLDLSVWSSIWSVEKQKLSTEKVPLKDSLFDFNVGYIGTVFLALCFLSLGALVIYGTGTELPKKGGEFANLLINMYTSSLGSWAYPLISAAALTTMFSTTLTCLDAFPRVLGRIVLLYARENPEQTKIAGLKKNQFNILNYWVWILVVACGAIILLAYLGGQMGLMVKVATILSFIAAPLFAFINFRVVTSKHMPQNARPNTWLRALSWIGIIFLTVFSVLFMVYWI